MPARAYVKTVIADSSAIAALFLKEEGYRDIASLFRSEPVHTLELALKESLNAVWKRSFQDKHQQNQAVQILDNLLTAVEGHVMEVIDQRQFYVEALRLALRSGKTVYDTLFVCAALSRGEKIATRDKEQAELARKLGVTAIVL